MQPIRPEVDVIERNEHKIVFRYRGEVYRVYSDGTYEQLVEIPLELLEPTETWVKNAARIARNAEMYREGSPFPPIDVVGLHPGRTKYRITNGHHRRLAALQCDGCEVLPAWTDFSVPVEGAPDFYRQALMSHTEFGHELAAHLGWKWCPKCKRFYCYIPELRFCRSCFADTMSEFNYMLRKGHPFRLRLPARTLATA